MRFFPAPFTPEESAAALARYGAQLARDGLSFLAAEHRGTGAFLGTLGLQTMRVEVPHLPPPVVEIGWRLATTAQGYGYATEGARALIDHAFNTLRLTEIVAVATHVNLPSRRVMEKLGMQHRPELTYEDTRVPAGHPLQPHVLYQLRNTSRSPITR